MIGITGQHDARSPGTGNLVWGKTHQGSEQTAKIDGALMGKQVPFQALAEGKCIAIGVGIGWAAGRLVDAAAHASGYPFRLPEAREKELCADLLQRVPEPAVNLR
jgi:hypothetical protein